MADTTPPPPPAGLTLRLWRSPRARPGKGGGGGGMKRKEAAPQRQRGGVAPPPSRARCSSSSGCGSGSGSDDHGGGSSSDSEASSSTTSTSTSSSSPSLEGWGGARWAAALPPPAAAAAAAAALPSSAPSPLPPPPPAALAAAARALGRWAAAEADRFNAAHAACPPSAVAAGCEEEFIALAARRARAVCGSAMAGVVEVVGRGPAGAAAARLGAAVWRAGSRAAADAVEALTARAVAWRGRALAAERELEAVSGGGGGGGGAAFLVPAEVTAAAAERRRRASQRPPLRRPTLFPPAPGAAAPPEATTTTTTIPDRAAAVAAEYDDDDTGRAAALAAAAAEVRALTARLAAAEAGADAGVDALSRADAAEATAADALARLGARTPRPDPPVTGAGVRALVAAGAPPGVGAAVAAAVAACRGWAARDMAALLLGDDASGATRGAAFTNPDALGCLATAWKAGSVTLASVAAALAAPPPGGRGPGGGAAAALVASLPPGSPHATWLEGRAAAGLTGARADALALFLCGCDGRGRVVPVEVYGTVPSADDGAVERAVLEASTPTADRVARLEKEVARLTAALVVVGRSAGGGGGGGSADALVAAALAGEDVAATAATASSPSTDPSQPTSTAAPPRPPPAPGLETFLAALDASAAEAGSADAAEPAWRGGFPPLGTGPAIPRLLRAAGPARIRNKTLSKRETERTVKEVWKEREAASAAGASAAREPLVDFLYAHLQKKVGIPAAVVEAGYNLIYGLWKYRWDADCELFLAILSGRVREDVKAAQAELQEDLAGMLAAAERAVGGGLPSGAAAPAASAAPPGTLAKAVVRDALRAYFRVGAPGGKSAPRFDALLQALDAVAPGGPGARVPHAGLFAEDREYNQGEFAEAVRDQALAERLEFFGEVERALLARVAARGEGGGGGGGEGGGGGGSGGGSGGASLATAVVSRADVAAALQACDAGLSAKSAWDRANDAFEPGVVNAAADALMLRLRAGTGRRLRASSAASGSGGSVFGGGGGGGGSMSAGGGGSIMARGGRGGPGLLPRRGPGAAGGGPRLSPAALAAVEAVRAATALPRPAGPRASVMPGGGGGG